MDSAAEHAPKDSTADDRQLLLAFVEAGSGRAFATLVERYVALVYSAALRQCGNDPHRAQDVTQIVFMALAKKAGQMGRESNLAGWLVRATHFTSRSLLRAESRRRRHESHAAMLRDQEAAMDSSHAVPQNAGPNSELWQRISPLLDGALAGLPSQLRDILVMRFLEGCAYASVGKRLGITEQAARKRAQRALLALRGALARKGIITRDDALEAALISAVAAPVPAELARAITVGVGTAHHHIFVLKGALKLMAWSKAKMTAAAVSAALLAGGGAVVVHRLTSRSNVQVIPLSSTDAAPVAVSVRQVPSAYPLMVRGTVRNADGQPVAGAKVMAPSDNIRFLELSFDPQMGPPTNPQAITRADGSFEIPVQKMPAGALVLAQQGAAEAFARSLTGEVNLTIQPYGRIEGSLRSDQKPVRVGTQILLSTAMLPGHGAQFQMRARTDQTGHFAIENVPPGRYAIFLDGANGEIRVSPGTSAQVDIDRPSGRTIVGKLEGIKERGSATFLLSPLTGKSSSQPGAAFFLNAWQFDVDVDLNGLFKIDHVPPGPFHLSVGIVANVLGAYAAEKNIQIPPISDGETPSPIDIGTLTLKP